MKKDRHYREQIRRRNAEKLNARRRKSAMLGTRMQKVKKEDEETSTLGNFGLQLLNLVQVSRRMHLTRKKDYSHRKR